ncbi:hypothetical protein HPB49_021913 [Dermacentor silvarum]|uniref:Uncharacterized protein n=1 Tax=Dermacentor silvarum TaxID=543639 RepID=A0ACB8CN67_DERSI|nr:hypothetical protein HPB49_021913 [Dermacentor silvarum]
MKKLRDSSGQWSTDLSSVPQVMSDMIDSHLGESHRQLLKGWMFNEERYIRCIECMRARRSMATDGWQLVLSRRQREAAKHNDKEKASNKNNINGGPSAGGAKGDGQNSETGIGRRNMRPARGKPLPPLPKNDIKIILKPHKGLMLKEYLKTEIPQAIIRSTGSIIPGSGPNQRKITGEDFILRIREGTNIIIVSTPSLEVADVIRRITCMELRGKQHPFNVYVADPDDSYKGVVHGFPAHTESADLQQHLRVRTQGVTIERARMLGSSNTALLTFAGGTRPKCVYYMGVEMRCTEYRPTVQMCLECMQEGHRSDVCPNPKNICRCCGLENPPPQGHECEVKCAVCRAAGHETRRCPNKLIAAKRGKTSHQSRSRERSEQRTKKAPGRWFESTEEEDLYRRRSRSRSSQGGTAKSSTPSRDPSGSRASQRSNSPLPKKQQVDSSTLYTQVNAAPPCAEAMKEDRRRGAQRAGRQPRTFGTQLPADAHRYWASPDTCHAFPYLR